MPFEFKNSTVPRLYGKDNLNNTHVSSVSCMWLCECACLQYLWALISPSVWRWESEADPIARQWPLCSGSSLAHTFRNEAAGLSPWLFTQAAWLLGDRDGWGHLGESSQVDGQLTLTCCQATEEVSAALGLRFYKHLRVVVFLSSSILLDLSLIFSRNGH